MAIDQTLSDVMGWLHGDCPVKYQLNLSSAAQLMSLLHSFLGSKMSTLSEENILHLCTLLLQAFIRALPCKGGSDVSLSDRVYLLPLPFIPTHFSSLWEGLLFSQDICSPFLDWDHLQLKVDKQDLIITALFDISLSGDQPPQGKSPRGKSPRGKSPRGKSPQGKSPRGKSPQGKSPQGK